MTRRRKIWLLICSVLATLVVAAFLFWLLAIVVVNGTLGNNAFINVSLVRHALMYASADDFHQAQIEVAERPKELSSEELARFLLRKDQQAQSTDPWGRLLQVTVWRRTGTNDGFCAGRVTSFVTKYPWGHDTPYTEEF